MVVTQRLSLNFYLNSGIEPLDMNFVLIV